MAEDNFLLGLKIMDLLRKNNDDKSEGLTQMEICRRLKTQYNTIVERKTINRHMDALLDYDNYNGKHLECTIKERSDGIETKTGFRYRSDFSEGELKVLIDSVLSNKHISKRYSNELAEKIEASLGMSKGLIKKLTKNIEFYDEQYKPNNPSFFYHVEQICEAIEKKKDVSIREYEYDINKDDHKVKRVYGPLRTLSPVQLFMLEQEYYMVALHDRKYIKKRHKTDQGVTESTAPIEERIEIRIIRVSDLMEVNILEEKNNEAAKIYKKMIPEMNASVMQEWFQYMDEKRLRDYDYYAPSIKKFVIPKFFLNQVVSRFGKKIRAEELEGAFWNGRESRPLLLVTVKTTFWALQRFMNEHRGHMYVLDPIRINYNLREEIEKRIIEKQIRKSLMERGNLDTTTKQYFAHGYYHVRATEIDLSPLSAEEKKQMKLLLAKMLGDDRNVNRRISETVL